jgi:dCMP deaminase
MRLRNSVAKEALIAYVPALHAGYLSFFAKYPRAQVFVLGKKFINAYPRLNRDLRALKPSDIAKALQTLGIEASVLEKSPATTLKPFTRFILPDEDISRDFAKRYLKGRKLTLKNIFLRWDGVFSNKENKVAPDRIITRSRRDRELMKKAVKEAEKSADWWRQIGALLVKNRKIVALSHIRYFPSDLALDIFGTPRITVDFGERPDLYISMHAEADLIAQAAGEGTVLKGASLYTSTFPCINCAFLIARSGIKKVYYEKGYSRIDAESVLKSAGVEIILVK